MDRIDQYFVDSGKFTKEEFKEHGDKIRDTYVYRKVRLQFALKDAFEEVLRKSKIK